MLGVFRILWLRCQRGFMKNFDRGKYLAGAGKMCKGSEGERFKFIIILGNGDCFSFSEKLKRTC